MTAAIEALYPDVLQTIGPAIEDGFYHDYDFGEQKVSDEVFPKIEKKMAELVKDWKGFTHKEVSKEEALKVFKNNKYKQELIEEFSKNGEKITLYTAGGFVDLCEGGHSEHPDKEIKYFKLLSIAGSYWRGSEKNKMLTRIYGTVFPTQKELDDYLMQLELAKLHDHRKLGKELELFAISEEVGPGLILWLPKGNIIKDEIEDWAKKTEKEWGYQRVTTPNITKSGLYFTSGHLPYYKDDMYPAMKLDGGEEYYLKPMNCPHHHMIFKSIPRSYKELPLRLAEYGTCYRYEASGELFGMLRVRGFTQNDSHIYCTQDQAVDEFVNVMKLHEYYYKSLGITDYHLELSLRDPKNKKKYHGNEEMWKLAEKLMREAVAKLNIKMVEQVGSAAFYGPKIDFIIKSSTGREFGISTNQIDLFMGERFGLKYVDKDGSEKTPVIIHRAPLGSHERFIGFLIEHFGGNFPTWLTPVQTRVLPVSEKHLEYAKKVLSKLLDAGIRAEVDDRSERIQEKIRKGHKDKVAYMLIVGDKEVETNTVTERHRSGKPDGPFPVETYIGYMHEEIDKKL
jgi:threonyl-tRNA synthetase